MKNYRLVIFEGGEAQGKSTLKKKFEKATNFKHLCIDRMFITSIVYNRYKGRHPELEKELYEDLDLFIKTFNPLFVVLKADKAIQKMRFKDRGDWYIHEEELEKIENIYADVVIELMQNYPENIYLLRNNDEKQMLENISKIEERCK